MSVPVKSSLSVEKITNYTHFLVLPLKFVACWEWFPKATDDEEHKIVINNIYLPLVLLVLTNFLTTLIVNIYTEWVCMMDSLEKLADGLPILASVCIVVYFALHRQELYELAEYMNANFKFRSANGLSNMTMWDSYKAAKNFAFLYTACTVFSVSVYVGLPVIFYFWTRQPSDSWIYMDTTQSVFYVLAFLRQVLGQAFVALALGQLGVFFAANSILLCGQLDLLCCSLRNARYTALLLNGVRHSALVAQHSDIQDDEMHNYIYTKAEMAESAYNYDEKITKYFANKISQFDIYSSEYDDTTISALQDCARMLQVINTYKMKFERFVSPLLVLRVVQVTLYMCTLLYASSMNFDMVTVEYLGAVALDIFVYCYFGNQIILQADRVTTAAYQSSWAALRVRARRLLLHVLLAARRPLVVRAGNFLPMDLHTYVAIIKTSFSYYTLLVNVNDK